jgi:hypothetical protein
MEKNNLTNYKLLIMLLLTFLNVNIFCQKINDPPVVLTLDVENNKFSSADLLSVPFDEEFVIVGTKKDFIGKIKVKYKIVGYCKNLISTSKKCKKAYRKGKHYYIFSKAQNESGYVHIESHETDNGSFRVDMPMLHPNENYEIVFDFINKFKLSDNDDTVSLKLKISNAIETTFNYGIAHDNQKSITELKSIIEENINSTIEGKDLYDKDGVTRVNFDNLFKTGAKLEDVRQKISTNYYNIYNTIKKINEQDQADPINPKIIDELYLNRKILFNKFNDILTKNHFKNFRENPIDLLIDKTFTIDSILKIIVKDFDRDNNWSSFNLKLNPKKAIDSISTNSYVLGIITGKVKFENSALKVSEKYDLNSIKLITTAFSLVKNRKYKNGKKLFPHKNFLNESIEKLNDLIDEVKEIKKYENNIVLAKSEFPDVFKNTYSKWSIASSLPTRVDIQSKATPYLGLDFGYLLAPEISSSFIFESINFHLVPVNRKAKMSQYKGWDKILKTTSIMVGFAQRVGNYDDNFETITEIGSPFVGAGFKLTRMLRVNGGFIFYRVKNQNPLISEKLNKNTYFIAASFDIKLKHVASFLTKLLIK